MKGLDFFGSRVRQAGWADDPRIWFWCGCDVYLRDDGLVGAMYVCHRHRPKFDLCATPDIAQAVLRARA